MRILLVQPPLNPNIIGAGTGYLTEPLALETVAGAVSHHETRILDMRLCSDLEGELSTFRPEIVGVTAYTTDVYAAASILAEVKEFSPEVLTVVGGHHASLLPQDFVNRSADVIVVGEGEVGFRELVDALARKKSFEEIEGLILVRDGELIRTPPREPRSNLDEMPLAARNLTKEYRRHYFRGMWRPVTSLFTSQGCPYRCKFCALWKVSGSKYRVRSPRSVVRELAGIDSQYVDFADDNTFHDVKRAREMAVLIRQERIRKTYKAYARSDTIVRHPDIVEKWKEIGLELVLIGFESFNDAGLKKLNKGTSAKINETAIEVLRQNQVEVVAYFIVDPDYSEDDFQSLGRYVEEMELRQPIFTVLTPLPGTDLYEEKFEELTTHDYNLYDCVHSVLPTRLPKERFYECLADLYRRFYSRPGSTEGKARRFSSRMMAQLYASLARAHLD